MLKLPILESPVVIILSFLKSLLMFTVCVYSWCLFLNVGRVVSIFIWESSALIPMITIVAGVYFLKGIRNVILVGVNEYSVPIISRLNVTFVASTIGLIAGSSGYSQIQGSFALYINNTANFASVFSKYVDDISIFSKFYF